MRIPAFLRAAAAALFLLPAAAGWGQSVQETLDISREKIEQQRRVLVSGALPLSDAEAKAFWPLYDGYEKERRKLDTRAAKLVADFVGARATLTDAQAQAMIQEVFRIDEDRVKLRRAYFERMARAIAPRKLLRFYQIENKLDSVVRADLSKQIPLVP
jgi:hypothetical protein